MSPSLAQAMFFTPPRGAKHGGRWQSPHAKDEARTRLAHARELRRQLTHFSTRIHQQCEDAAVASARAPDDGSLAAAREAASGGDCAPEGLQARGDSQGAGDGDDVPCARAGPCIGWGTTRRLCCVTLENCAGTRKNRDRGFVRASGGSLQIGTSRWSRRFAADALYICTQDIAADIVEWRRESLDGRQSSALTVLAFGAGAWKICTHLPPALPGGFWHPPASVSGFFLKSGELLPRDIWEHDHFVAPGAQRYCSSARDVEGLRRAIKALLDGSNVDLLTVVFSWGAPLSRLVLACVGIDAQAEFTSWLKTPVTGRSIEDPNTSALESLLLHCESSYPSAHGPQGSVAAPDMWLVGCIHANPIIDDMQTLESLSQACRGTTMPEWSRSLSPTRRRVASPSALHSTGLQVTSMSARRCFACDTAATVQAAGRPLRDSQCSSSFSSPYRTGAFDSPRSCGNAGEYVAAQDAGANSESPDAQRQRVLPFAPAARTQAAGAARQQQQRRLAEAEELQVYMEARNEEWRNLCRQRAALCTNSAERLQRSREGRGARPGDGSDAVAPDGTVADADSEWRCMQHRFEEALHDGGAAPQAAARTPLEAEEPAQGGEGAAPESECAAAPRRGGGAEYWKEVPCAPLDLMPPENPEMYRIDTPDAQKKAGSAGGAGEEVGGMDAEEWLFRGRHAGEHGDEVELMARSTEQVEAGCEEASAERQDRDQSRSGRSSIAAQESVIHIDEANVRQVDLLQGDTAQESVIHVDEANVTQVDLLQGGAAQGSVIHVDEANVRQVEVDLFALGERPRELEKALARAAGSVVASAFTGVVTAATCGAIGSLLLPLEPTPTARSSHDAESDTPCGPHGSASFAADLVGGDDGSSSTTTTSGCSLPHDFDD